MSSEAMHLSNDRINLFVNSESREEATKMGLFDRILDYFNNNKKKAALNEFYDLTHSNKLNKLEVFAKIQSYALPHLQDSFSVEKSDKTGNLHFIVNGIELFSCSEDEANRSVDYQEPRSLLIGALARELSNSNIDNDLARTLINRVRGHQSATDIKIPMHVRPENCQDYKKLQIAISKLIPKESERPTIHLSISNDSNLKPQLLIVGGTGPLSDAEMITKAMTLTDTSKPISIELLSSPPPREFSFSGVFNYIKGVKSFLNSNAHSQASICLASNTAHLHINKMKMLAPYRANNFVNVVDKIVGNLDTNSKPLILGTIDAHNAGLYSNKFNERGIDTLVLNNGGEALKTPSKDDLMSINELKASNIQSFINFAKNNGFDQDISNKLYNLIQQHLLQISATHIILGCTELPLALGEENILKLNTTCNVIDSEDTFTETYAHLISDHKIEYKEPLLPIKHIEDLI